MKYKKQNKTTAKKDKYKKQRNKNNKPEKKKIKLR